jgi:hypothetical protein
MNKTHGMSSTAIYTKWKGMITRCYNEASEFYMDYGGRGITVCERWRGKGGFENFYADMGDVPENKPTIDRIDVNGDYCPENCRWADEIDQANNKRNNRFLTYNGESLTSSQWARRIGISERVIKDRVRLGWDADKILTTPVLASGRRTGKTRLLGFNGEMLSVTEWSKRTGIRRETIGRRLKLGWSTEQAITTPPDTVYDINHKRYGKDANNSTDN